jgi:hypothetical protein
LNGIHALPEARERPGIDSIEINDLVFSGRKQRRQVYDKTASARDVDDHPAAHLTVEQFAGDGNRTG